MLRLQIVFINLNKVAAVICCRRATSQATCQQSASVRGESSAPAGVVGKVGVVHGHVVRIRQLIVESVAVELHLVLPKCEDGIPVLASPRQCQGIIVQIASRSSLLELVERPGNTVWKLRPGIDLWRHLEVGTCGRSIGSLQHLDLVDQHSGCHAQIAGAGFIELLLQLPGESASLVEHCDVEIVEHSRNLEGRRQGNDLNVLLRRVNLRT
mmetsp:Transcript_9697/g.13618  ORF Transcript_9697/g.13618 Transcript_9697/m.13618 type:complete len:211 (+) Transcript_9697:1816-2448(+)